MNRKMRKIATLILVTAVLFTIMPDIAKAEEGNKFVNFLRKVLTYPFRATKKSTEVVTETATKGVETVVETGEAAVGVTTGKVEEIDDLFVEPVKGSVETTVTAVEGTVTMPIEAVKEEEEPAAE